VKKTFSQWPIETVLAFVGVVFLFVALFYGSMQSRNTRVNGKSLFLLWLILFVLAALIRLLRSGAREIRSLLGQRRRGLAGVSVLMQLATTAVFIRIEFWLAKLIFTRAQN
jgi:hypothetical protein